MATIKYESATHRTFGDLPAIGSRAPDLSLVNTRLQNATLANWMGMRKVMNIIVSIDTDVCAKSVIEFDRRAENLKDVAMLNVSYDLPFAFKRFQEQHELQNIIGLSAIRHEGFGENYGVQIVDGPLAGMFSRAVVVLDENNTVVHQEQIEDISTEPNYDAAMRAIGVSIAEE
ncbi:MAG: thiol peroxidase [Woeseiaceae bacterium]